jgi:hypothetical protein
LEIEGLYSIRGRKAERKGSMKHKEYRKVSGPIRSLQAGYREGSWVGSEVRE